MPGRSSASIDVRLAHAAEKARQAGRDVNLELWRASRWTMPESTYTAPGAAERLAADLGVPVFQVLKDASLEVQFPRCELTEALLDAYARASEFEQRILVSILRDSSPWDEGSWLDTPAAAALSPEVQRLLTNYVNRKEVHGPYRILRHAPFPIDDYLLPGLGCSSHTQTYPTVLSRET